MLFRKRRALWVLKELEWLQVSDVAKIATDASGHGAETVCIWCHGEDGKHYAVCALRDVLRGKWALGEPEEGSDG